jgi:predicted nucleic acid-binding protein
MPCLNAGIDEQDLAAQFFNRCSARGIAASAVDMLICAVSVTADVAILTADKDFSRYARMLPITLVA